MNKNVLVISDNSYMRGRIIELIEKKQIVGCNFSFSMTPLSQAVTQKNVGEMCESRFEIAEFNLKNENDVKKIIETFDLVISMHCKQIFPPSLTKNVRCVNVHPGYNPINRGWYPQVFAIINDVPIGATIHEIDDQLDHGAIIAREFVKKNNFDTSKTLYDKILEKEIELLESWLERIVHNNYVPKIPENEGNLYLKRDFKNLLKIDLTEPVTMGQAINRLRALTHGSFKNAYFIDEKTRKKVFLGISFEIENI